LIELTENVYVVFQRLVFFCIVQRFGDNIMKAELIPAGSFIPNTPPPTTSSTAARRHSVAVATKPSRRTTPAAAQQVPTTVQDDAKGSEVNERQRRAKRPSSAWKSRHRRPRFTDNFDAFDDYEHQIVDLDVEHLHLNDRRTDAQPATRDNNNSSSDVPKTGLDVVVVKSEKDLSQTPRAWQDDDSTNATSASKSSGHLLSMLTRPEGNVVTMSEPHRDASAHNNPCRGSTSSENNWTSSDETPKRGDSVVVELAPDFQMSHIRARVLEKYRSVSGIVDLENLNVKVIN